ncbi:MAG: AAA family ATPase, partial [Anaerolineales bacterium]
MPMGGPLRTASLNKSLISPILVGRARPLNSLSQLVEQAGLGHGQTVILAGEAGVGKTRLVAEVRRLAEPDLQVALEGHCFEPDRALPFAPLLDLLQTFLAAPGRLDRLLADPAMAPLAALVPELYSGPFDPAPAGTLPAEEDRRKLFQSLVHFLLAAASPGPRIIVIEDLHWSDDASLAFLRHFARRIAAQPVLLLLTYRNDDMPLSLTQFLAGLDRERLAAELALDRLEPAEVGQLLQAVFAPSQPPRADFVAALHDLTEGNLFFIEEVLRSLVSARGADGGPGVWDRTTLESLQIPRSVRVGVQQRAAQLSPAARSALELAAVTGRRFKFGLLRALTGTTEAELLLQIREMLSAQLIVEVSADQFAFRHALMREAIYATLLKRELARCHLAVAETFERLYAGTAQLDRYLGDIAGHYYRAQAWEKAQQYATAAGERAQRIFAPREAIDNFTRALQAATALGHAPPAGLHRSRAQAYELEGDFERAEADYQRVLRQALSAGDLRAEWQAHMDLGLHWAARDYDRSGEHLQQALALARGLGDPLVLAHSLNRLGNQLLNLGSPEQALELHHEARSIFEAAHEQLGLAQTYDLIGMASFLRGDLAGGTEYYRRAVALFREADERQGLVSSLASLTLGSCTYQTSTMMAAAPLAAVAMDAQAALSLARAIHQRSGEAYALFCLSLCQGPAGDYELALESAQAGLRLAEEIEHHQWQTAAH